MKTKKMISRIWDIPTPSTCKISSARQAGRSGEAVLGLRMFRVSCDCSVERRLTALGRNVLVIRKPRAATGPPQYQSVSDPTMPIWEPSHTSLRQRQRH